FLISSWTTVPFSTSRTIASFGRDGRVRLGKPPIICQPLFSAHSVSSSLVMCIRPFVPRTIASHERPRRHRSVTFLGHFLPWNHLLAESLETALRYFWRRRGLNAYRSRAPRHVCRTPQK